MKVSVPVIPSMSLRSPAQKSAETGGEGSGFQNAYENLFKEKQKQSPESEVDEPEIRQAIDELELQKILKENELSASMEGHGPGLRVTLKDGSGAIIRQLSGAEFVALQMESTGAPVGRILDQKA